MKFIDSHHDRWHALGGEDGPPHFTEGMVAEFEVS